MQVRQAADERRPQTGDAIVGQVELKQWLIQRVECTVLDCLDYVTTQVKPFDGRTAARRVGPHADGRDSVVGQHDRLDAGGRLLYLGWDSREGVVR